MKTYNNETSLSKAIKEALDEKNAEEIVEIWNDYCDAVNYPDDRIYVNDPEELFHDMGVIKLINIGQCSDYHIYEEYMQFTIYGAKSFGESRIRDAMDIDSLINWIAEDEDRYTDYCDIETEVKNPLISAGIEEIFDYDDEIEERFNLDKKTVLVDFECHFSHDRYFKIYTENTTTEIKVIDLVCDYDIPVVDKYSGKELLEMMIEFDPTVLESITDYQKELAKKLS